MINPIKILVFSFILCGISSHLSAQQYAYSQYNSSNGAPFDKVSSIVKDNSGFMWIGSQNGLFRYDGINYEDYGLFTESQFIHRLRKSNDQLYFVNDISLYNIVNTSTKPDVRLLLEGTIEESRDKAFYPNDFILGKKGDVWVSQSNHQVGRLHENVYKTYGFAQSEKAQKLELQEDSNGRIWVLSSIDGLFLFDNSTNSFVRKSDIKGGKALLIHDDSLIVGGDDLSVFSLNGSELRLHDTIPLENDSVSAMYVNDRNEFFIGTENGNLFKWESLNANLNRIYGGNEAHRVERLNFGYINEIYVTRDTISDNDILWVCSDTGLWILKQQFFKTVRNLPMNNPIAISMGNAGQAWAPINYLYEITPENGEYTAKPIYDNLQANAVVQDKNGFLWVTTSTPRVELRKYNGDKLLGRYDFHDRGESIFYLYPDSSANLWFCQAPVDKPIVGIGQISSKGEVVYYDSSKGFASRVLAIKESSRGEIYAVGIGESSYLYKYDPKTDQFINLSPPLPFKAILNFEAHDLTIDDRGIVWLATTDGLLRYDSEKITLIKNDILGQEEVRGVTHFPDNSVWIATATKGLVFLKDNICTTLGELEGLPSVISAYRCITTDLQGHLWAGTAEGLVYSRISASSLPNSHVPRFTSVSTSDYEFTNGFDRIFSVKKNDVLQLKFTNLSFPANNVEYQYRMILSEDKQIRLEEQLWQSIGTSNTLSLDQIDIGEYSLELRARQPGGYQWSKPVELRLEVFTPWYMKTGLIYGAIAALLILISYYFRVYVKQRFKRLQNVLRYSNEKLANKEAQLNQKIKEFEEQKTELDNANSNIQTLELFIREIPNQASWNDIITAMSKAVNQAIDINAFEIAFKEDQELVHRGYSNQERSGYTFRSKPFNPKTSLSCWAMTNNQEVLINDYEKEHTMYIEQKPAYRFNSLIFVPFTLSNNQPVVLCAYSIEKNSFDNNDLVMFRILAQFIHFSIHHELTKQL